MNTIQNGDIPDFSKATFLHLIKTSAFNAKCFVGCLFITHSHLSLLRNLAYLFSVCWMKVSHERACRNCIFCFIIKQISMTLIKHPTEQNHQVVPFRWRRGRIRSALSWWSCLSGWSEELQLSAPGRYSRDPTPEPWTWSGIPPGNTSTLQLLRRYLA